MSINKGERYDEAHSSIDYGYIVTNTASFALIRKGEGGADIDLTLFGIEAGGDISREYAHEISIEFEPNKCE